MYVCMYVCTYVRTYVRTYVCMYVYICMYVCMYIYIYVRAQPSGGRLLSALQELCNLPEIWVKIGASNSSLELRVAGFFDFPVRGRTAEP